jgi:hypothetical protein
MCSLLGSKLQNADYRMGARPGVQSRSDQWVLSSVVSLCIGRASTGQRRTWKLDGTTVCRKGFCLALGISRKRLARVTSTFRGKDGRGSTEFIRQPKATRRVPRSEFKSMEFETGRINSHRGSGPLDLESQPWPLSHREKSHRGHATVQHRYPDFI